MTLPRQIALFRIPLAFALLLAALPTPLRASCDLAGWLGSVRRNATALEQSLGTPDQAMRAMVLGYTLTSAPEATLDRDLAAAGMGQDLVVIHAYLDTLARALTLLQAAAPPQETQALLTGAEFRALDLGLQAALARTGCAEPDDAPRPPTRLSSDNSNETDLASARNPARTDETLPAAGGKSGRQIEPATFLTLLAMISLIATLAASWLRRRSLRQRRRAERHMVSITCRLEDENTPFLAEIVDISQLGAKLRTQRVLPEAQQIIISLAGRRVRATVRWSNRYYSGVVFQRPLPETLMPQLLDRGVILSPLPPAKTQNGAPA